MPAAAAQAKLQDHIRPGVRVLFVGINPGLRSAAIGHHFAGPSNRFWKLLYDAGLVPEPISTEDDGRLPVWGYGITNLVPRATAGVSDLKPSEYRDARSALLRKIEDFQPDIVALVGLTLMPALFPRSQKARERCRPGLQPEQLFGSRVFVLPNPSGRNAHFSYAEMLRWFRALKRLVDEGSRRAADERR